MNCFDSRKSLLHHFQVGITSFQSVQWY
uniref:Uncharacterized protein n=1 Tax=Anguilla anguilla TaxID=7936 RepID=A0A0E9VCT6_ANGAN